MSEAKNIVNKWNAGKYPYDIAIECHNCVTQHATLKCDVAAHQPLVEEAKALGLRPPSFYRGSARAFRQAVLKLREKYTQFFEEKV